jgi:hypothetical protein
VKHARECSTTGDDLPTCCASMLQSRLMRDWTNTSAFGRYIRVWDGPVVRAHRAFGTIFLRQVSQRWKDSFVAHVLCWPSVPEDGAAVPLHCPCGDDANAGKMQPPCSPGVMVGRSRRIQIHSFQTKPSQGSSLTPSRRSCMPIVGKNKYPVLFMLSSMHLSW